MKNISIIMIYVFFIFASNAYASSLSYVSVGFLGIFLLIGFIVIRMRIQIKNLEQKLSDESQIVRDQVKANDRLKKELQRVGSIFHASQEGVIITNPQMEILDTNEAYQAMSGYSYAELLSKKPVVLYSNRHDLVFYAEMNHALEAKGTWRGEVWDKKKNGEEYIKYLRIDSILNSDKSVESYIIIVSDVTEIKKEQERLEHQANFDVLTNIPNRNQFRIIAEHTLALSKRNESRSVVAFLDVDHFKQINDMYGQGAGDNILKQIAQRLEKQLRESDVIARIGGDEFLILMPDIQSSHSVYTSLDRIMSVMREPFVYKTHELNVSVSMGVTFFPEDGDDIDILIRRAGIAMYRSKERGRNRITYFQWMEMKEDGIKT
ncbi:MAG: diguanylate cyclase [Sulfuricurvum sp.]|nr:diguanylate cyclase [Sulfuricurvum sp.]